MFVSFSQHSPKLKFRSSSYCILESVYQQELEQEDFKFSEAGGYFAGKKSQFHCFVSLEYVKWLE